MLKEKYLGHGYCRDEPNSGSEQDGLAKGVVEEGDH